MRWPLLPGGPLAASMIWRVRSSLRSVSTLNMLTLDLSAGICVEVSHTPFA